MTITVNVVKAMVTEVNVTILAASRNMVGNCSEDVQVEEEGNF